MSKKIEEGTGIVNVAIPDSVLNNTGPSGIMPCGSPFFDCTDDQFWGLHQHARGNGKWFSKHYQDTNMANWARENKGKKFYLKHESGMFRQVKSK